MTRSTLFLLAIVAGVSLGLSLASMHMSIQNAHRLAALNHVVFGTEPTP